MAPDYGRTGANQPVLAAGVRGLQPRAAPPELALAPSSHTTRFRRTTSAYQCAESFGIRRCVLKST